MEKFTFTQSVLDAEENKSAIEAIETELGRKLVTDETIHFESALCNGVQCEEGYVCVFGNCVKDDAPIYPEEESDNG